MKKYYEYDNVLYGYNTEILIRYAVFIPLALIIIDLIFFIILFKNKKIAKLHIVSFIVCFVISVIFIIACYIGLAKIKNISSNDIVEEIYNDTNVRIPMNKNIRTFDNSAVINGYKEYILYLEEDEINEFKTQLSQDGWYGEKDFAKEYPQLYMSLVENFKHTNLSFVKIVEKENQTDTKFEKLQNYIVIIFDETKSNLVIVNW